MEKKSNITAEQILTEGVADIVEVLIEDSRNPNRDYIDMGSPPEDRGWRRLSEDISN